MNNENGFWAQSGLDDYTTEVSMNPTHCPRCGEAILQQHKVRTDRDASGEDVYGWHFRHPCGAKLLVIND